jgi:uncharacterized phage-associated protein
MMAMPTAIDIADWIVRFRADDIGVPIDLPSLEKHLFYAQSFRLALIGEVLFDDEFEAWRNGPVLPEVYQCYRGFGANSIIPSDGHQRSLGDVESYVEEVVDFFGGYTSIQLSRATHSEEPWQKARQGVGRHDSSKNVIPNDELRRYYSLLISDGEDALSRQELLGILPEPRWGWMYVAGISFRRMSFHPFYNIPLAEKLAEDITAAPTLPDRFYEPVVSKEYIDIGDVSELSSDQIVERVKHALDREPGSNTEGDMAAPPLQR